MVKRDWRAAACGAGLLILASLVGCGPNLGSPAKVTGKVTVDGEPISGATVTFHSESGLPAEQRTQQTTTGGDGSYTLPTVYPSKYQVTVAEGAGTDAGMDIGNQPAVPPGELKPAAGDELVVDVAQDMTYDIQLTRANAQ